MPVLKVKVAHAHCGGVCTWFAEQALKSLFPTMMSSEATGGRQLTDQEKEGLSDILTRAGLSYLKYNFLRDKVRILMLLNM